MKKIFQQNQYKTSSSSKVISDLNLGSQKARKAVRTIKKHLKVSLKELKRLLIR